MILYLDTSSLVKLYVQESNSRETKLLAQSAQVLATARIAYVEARAAFARKRRDRGLSAAQYRSIIRYLDQDWDSYFIVDISESLVKMAASLAERHSLRALDAIHLASGVAIHEKVAHTLTFHCFDVRLSAAARDEGLHIPE